MQDLPKLLDAITPYLKDYTGIFVAIIGATLAILTYRRAKETVLQPVRTEVIKRQADLMMDLLAFLQDESTITRKTDYRGIIALNIVNSMLQCGAVFKDHRMVEKRLRDDTAGGIFLTDTIDMTIVPIFDEDIASTDNNSDKLPDKKYYNLAKKGRYTLTELNITNSYVEFEERYSEFRGNPLLPKKIIELLDELREQIVHNLTVSIPTVVSKAVNESYAKKTTPFPNPAGIYNQFNRQRLSHRRTVEALRTEIRSYLKIDTMP